jgi:Ca2+-binding RTX toxin-like protein
VNNLTTGQSISDTVIVQTAGGATQEINITINGVAENIPTEGPDNLTGAPGADTINALGGDDTVNGGGGVDQLNGGAGNDVIVLDLSGLPAGISFALSRTLAGPGLTLPNGTNLRSFERADIVLTAFNDRFTGGALDDAVDGGAGNDALSGGAGNDWIAGGLGNDRLVGGLGLDTLLGGQGNDHYVVDAVGDIVAELDGEGVDTVEAWIDYTLGAFVEALVLRGAATSGVGNDLNNRITGNGLNNQLDGGQGNDTLSGGEGDDLLIGGLGNDNLVGGGGADTLRGGAGLDSLRGNTGADLFVLDGGPADRIADFVSGEDRLAIDIAAFDPSYTGAPFILVSGATPVATGGAGQFLYDTAGAGRGTLWWDPDGAGGQAAVAVAVLLGSPTLDVADIVWPGA